MPLSCVHHIMNDRESFSHAFCADESARGGREVSAFNSAVTEFLGPGPGQHFGRGLARTNPSFLDSSPRATSRDWRTVTIAVSARVANRLKDALSSAVARRIDNGHEGGTDTFV